VSLAGFDPWPAQAAVHLEWGVAGTREAAARGDAVVIVDVLRFSTTIVTAVEQGVVAMVLSPQEIDDLGGSMALSRAWKAIVVAQNRQSSTNQYSLSPLSLRSLPAGERVVFSSVNGANAVAAASGASAVVAGSLRNRRAVVRYLSSQLEAGAARRATLIACGEQWSTLAGDAGLRPCLEDYLGAGAIAAGLGQAGWTLSAEARAAAAGFADADARILEALLACVSGRELVFKGLRDDVVFAAGLDCSEVVPVLAETEGNRGFQAVGTR
jgi:2-phosphosulfolactate phosphatase